MTNRLVELRQRLTHSRKHLSTLEMTVTVCWHLAIMAVAYWAGMGMLALILAACDMILMALMIDMRPGRNDIEQVCADAYAQRKQRAARIRLL